MPQPPLLARRGERRALFSFRFYPSNLYGPFVYSTTEFSRAERPMRVRSPLLALLVILCSRWLWALPQSQDRSVSGVIVTGKGEVVKGVSIFAQTARDGATAVSNDDGQFSLDVPDEDVALRIGGTYIKTQELTLPVNAPSTNLRITIDFLIPPI